MTSRLEDIVAAFTTELDDSTVTIAIGRKELHRNVEPPRIVFERIGGDVAMTQDIGRQDIGGTDGTRQLLTRNLTVKAHCWGATEEIAEQLMHNAIVAMHNVAQGSLLVGSEEWPNEATEGDTTLGEEVTIEFGLQIPVVDALQVLALPADTDFASTGTFADEAGACG